MSSLRRRRTDGSDVPEKVEDLFRTRERELVQYATRLIGPAAAEDIAAQAFEIAVRRLPSNHPHPVGWLYRTVQNLCRAESRRLSREGSNRGDSDTPQSSGGVDSDALLIRDLIAKLPRGQREVVRLVYWDGLPASDVAVVLRCSESAVWKRLSRARASLKTAWLDEPERDHARGEVSNVS
jgi:RNA polymerase sigma factor (sigma-70 family)